jgi:hypothetical protein
MSLPNNIYLQEAKGYSPAAFYHPQFGFKDDKSSQEEGVDQMS